MATTKVSAGLLMFHAGLDDVRVLLVHPGGPFFRNKDVGAWSIPKGEPATGEDLRPAAIREFVEETGLPAREPFWSLGEVRQKGGKVVHAWAFAGEDLPPSFVPASNAFTIEWPPRSGRQQSFPEVDRGELYPLAVARVKLTPAQVPFVDRLEALLAQARA